MSADGTALTGGVSSDIRIVETSTGPIVVKRALDKLKVAADWHSNPTRAETEVRALKVAAELLGADHVPTVLWEEPKSHSFAMTVVDPALRNWKTDLLSGLVDSDTACAAGALLGQLHGRSAGRADIRTAFADTTNFVELRIEPFFDRVARILPDLASPFHEITTEMVARRSVLVHGDFSPKNMLVDGARIVILDFEVAHWGDPAFDLSFCISHLLLKARRRGVASSRFLTAIISLLDGYADAGGTGPDDEHLAKLTGCLLLARIDGASPVDYSADFDAQTVRQSARNLLLEPPHSLRAALSQKGHRIP